ncbi:hypothetical protein SBV1_370096 [Verrucomicrobia bacterium]|nr:hypothetical protein SBV1_370096 [Verrucomicrobiota bacterium]
MDLVDYRKHVAEVPCGKRLMPLYSLRRRAGSLTQPVRGMEEEPGDGSAGASPYRAHPTSDAYGWGGGSREARFRFSACIGTMNRGQRTDPSP